VRWRRGLVEQIGGDNTSGTRKKARGHTGRSRRRLQRAIARTSGLFACRESPARTANTGLSGEDSKPCYAGFDFQLEVCVRQQDIQPAWIQMLAAVMGQSRYLIPLGGQRQLLALLQHQARQGRRQLWPQRHTPAALVLQ